MSPEGINMRFEFLNRMWAKIADSETLINRLHVSSFEYDNHILEIYLGIRCIKLIVDEKQYERFKAFLVYGCTL